MCSPNSSSKVSRMSFVNVNNYHSMKALFLTLDALQVQEAAELKVLYRKECKRRKTLYNQLQEIRGNLRVCGCTTCLQISS